MVAGSLAGWRVLTAYVEEETDSDGTERAATRRIYGRPVGRREDRTVSTNTGGRAGRGQSVRPSGSSAFGTIWNMGRAGDSLSILLSRLSDPIQQTATGECEFGAASTSGCRREFPLRRSGEYQLRSRVIFPQHLPLDSRLLAAAPPSHCTTDRFLPQAQLRKRFR